MAEFEGIADASTAVRNWLIINEAKLPDHLKDRLTALAGTGVSPVDLIVNFAEAVYANEKDFTKEAKELAASAAVTSEAFGFHGFAQAQKGTRIAKVLRGEAVAKDKRPAFRDDLLKPTESAPEPTEA